MNKQVLCACSFGGANLPDVGVVIPCNEVHDHFLAPLFVSIRPDPHVIDKVVVARSGLKKSDEQAYRLSLEQMREKYALQFPIVLSASTHHCTAGENRNRGWSLVSSRFTAFLDADDLYSRQRIKKLLSPALVNAPVNFIVHNYNSTTSESSKISSADPCADLFGRIELVRNESIYEATFQHGRCRNSEGRQAGDTNLMVPSSNRGFWPVHHGHAFVLTSVRDSVRFYEGPPGPVGAYEDGQFCRDVLEYLGGVLYTSEVLSQYRPQNSAQLTPRLRFCAAQFLRSTIRLGRLMQSAWRVR